MFSSLPRRCVVLLEDIDSVDLIKRQEEGEKFIKPVDDAIAKIGVELSKTLKNASKNNEKGRKNKKISLFDLLNAIDDVTSHEERVLVMTINCLEKLDEALIRSDRIDMKVEFIMITRFQIFELFTRMYFFDDSSSKLIATFSKETLRQQQQQQQQQQLLRNLSFFSSVSTSSRSSILSLSSRVSAILSSLRLSIALSSAQLSHSRQWSWIIWRKTLRLSCRRTCLRQSRYRGIFSRERRIHEERWMLKPYLESNHTAAR